MNIQVNPARDYTLITDISKTQMEAIYVLRAAAWRARVPLFPDIQAWRDAEDDTSLHWAILHDDVVVAAARLTIRDKIPQLPNAELYKNILPDLDGPVASINRLVVDKKFAGQGLSQKLDRARLAFADAQGVAHILATTQAGPTRTDALTQQGFRLVGEAALYDHGPLATLHAKAVAAGGGGEKRFYSALCPSPPVNINLIRSVKARLAAP